MNIYRFIVSISALVPLLILGLVKGQNDVPFRIEKESTFPQWRVGDNNLNGLQVVSRPLPGESFFSLDGEKNKSSIVGNRDNYKLLIDVFPDYKISNNNISDVDALILHRGKSIAESWSYHRFPIKYGGIAYRYLAHNSSETLNWIDLFHEYERNLPEVMIKAGKTRTLSPIEKYEYLIGNINFTMTQNQWKEGQDYLEQFRSIPDWIGICHGTAPAALNSLRPINVISLKSYNEEDDIIFYPSDIKVLLSYAWANNASYSGIMGMRCGRVVHYDQRSSLNCLDPNPGSFHLTVLNLLGLNGQAFIIDSSSGNEVWNKSIKSYRYQYFKPGTRIFTDKLKYALMPIADYKNDPHSMYRSPQATSLVGVWMELTYILGTEPSDRKVDGVKDDVFGTISFWYDLEINQAGNIIGGEWQNGHHPDFLWLVSNDVLPKSSYDYMIDNSLRLYDGENALPQSIIYYAKLAARKDQILYSILESMLKISRKED